MAVPTVTSTSPNSGSTRGRNIIQIIGTNFRLPNTPSATGPIQSNQQKTVSVQFEGVESEWAYSASDTLILAKIPPWTGSYSIAYPVGVDVRVANLDDSEIEIAGENATLADGYSQDRMSLATEPYLQYVIRQMMKLFRIHILKNTHHTTSRDFSLTPAQGDTVRAQGPLVQLHGPRMPINRFYSVNREEPEDDPLGGVNGKMRREVPVTVDLEFGVSMWANSDRHIKALTQSLLQFHRDITTVDVQINPNDPAEGTKDYEFVMPWNGYPEVNTDPNQSDLLSVTAQSHLRGVHIDENFGTIIERGWIITQNDGEPELQIQSL